MLEKHEELASFSMVEGEEHMVELVGNEAVFQGVLPRDLYFFICGFPS